MVTFFKIFKVLQGNILFLVVSSQKSTPNYLIKEVDLHNHEILDKILTQATDGDRIVSRGFVY